jgi:hypothetical protein
MRAGQKRGRKEREAFCSDDFRGSQVRPFASYTMKLRGLKWRVASMALSVEKTLVQ